MGFFSDLGSKLGGIVKNPLRAAEAVGTFGTSEIARSALGGVDPALVAGPVALGFMTGNPMLGAQIGAGIYSGQMAANSARDANAQNVALAQQQMMFSAQQAERQMAFQERMSSTAIQRAKRDMLAAGINPMLAPTAQESSPAGGMGSYNAAHVDPVPSVAMAATNSAREAISTFSSFKKDMAAADASNAAAALARKEAGLKGLKGPEADFEAKVFKWLNGFLDRASSSAKKLSGEGIKRSWFDRLLGIGGK